MAAVETAPEGKPVRLKLRRVSAFSSRALSNFAKRSLDPKCEVVSDGLACFGGRRRRGVCTYSYQDRLWRCCCSHPDLQMGQYGTWEISKPPIVGTYRAIDQKHVPRYLAEFEYRFNRRYDLAAMMPRLTWSSVRTTPMPYRLLKLADVYE